MFKPKMIRLIIYLVISIGLIILLVNSPTETTLKKEKKIENDSIRVIKLPKEQEPLNQKNEYLIKIDSTNVYIHDRDTLKLDELLSDIGLQKQKRPKLILLISVHSRSKSDLLMKVIEFAKREKIKIGIIKQ